MLYEPIPSKRCTKCLNWYLATTENFYVDKRYHCLFSYCKACIRAKTKALKDADPQKKKQADREYQATHREQLRPKARIRQQNYRDRHPGKSAEYQRKKRAENPDKAREEIRASHKRHPETRRRNEQIRRARMRGLPATLTDNDWQRALEYFDYRCAYCGEPCNRFHYEHHISVTNGGGFVPENIVPSCGKCNSSKFNHDPHAWLLSRFPDDAAEIEARILAYFASLDAA